MAASRRLKRQSTTLAVVIAVSALATVGAFIGYRNAELALQQAHETKFESYRVAQQLRRSSDELTRFVRTYVATQDEQYRNYFNQVLDIRSGDAPRPNDYHLIYWDFQAASGEPPRPAEEPLALQDMVDAAGFTEEEQELLATAEERSNALAELEGEAMDLVQEAKNTDDPAERREMLAEARSLVFGDDYHQTKAGIMEPIQRFFESMEARTQSAVEDARQTAFVFAQLLTASLVVLVLAVLVALWGVYSRILNPVRHLQTAMSHLAAGDTERTIPETERGDELGDMARANETFRQEMQRNERLQAEQREQEQRQKQERQRAREEMAEEFEAQVGDVIRNIAREAESMRSQAGSLSSVAEQTESQASNVASASEEASHNVQTVSSSTEELTSSISEISRQIAQASEISMTASTKASSTNEQIDNLNEAAKKIGEVVKLIQDIAGQTNLLALNATIESARAGEAGKGFAVVANEVKNLASQTQEATEQIRQQIESVQNETQSAVSAVQEIGRVVDQMAEISQSVATAVEEQQSATQEIARNVQETSDGTQQVAQNIEGVKEAVGQTREHIDSVESTAQRLQDYGETLRGEVDKFLAQMRNTDESSKG